MAIDDRCETCGEELVDCVCVPALIEGQEELFPVAEPPDERKGGPEWA